MTEIFLIQNGQQTGPFDRDTLLRLLNTGTLDRQTQSFCEGMEEWRPLWEVLGIPRSTAARNQTAEPAFATPAETIIVGFDLPFWTMVRLMVKIGIASIPAMLIIYILIFMVTLILGSIFGVFTGAFTLPK